MELTGCSAVVTGGASGLGAATVRRLHAGGAAVVILDLPQAEDAARELAAALGDHVRYVPGNVTVCEDVGGAVAAAAELAPVRVAVAAAGIAPPSRLTGPGEELRQHFARMLDVNLIGSFSLLSQAAAAMAATEPLGEERGVVVCTASIAAFDGQIGQVAYAASKAGVAGMTLPAARELARDLVRVVTIAPGLFDTPMFADVPPEVRDSVGKQVPHPARLGAPDEYAALVQHIVENPMLNGEVVRLDGAIRMGAR